MESLVKVAGELPSELLPFRLGGHSPDEIQRHSDSLAEPLPPEVALIYRYVEGLNGSEVFGQENAPESRAVWIYPLAEIQWIESPAKTVFHELASEFPEWVNAKYLRFGQGRYGDELAYCAHPPNRPDGAVVMLDHESAAEQCIDQPMCVVIYGETVAAWIQRWIDHRFVEYGYLTGASFDLPPREARRFKRAHDRLNPGFWGSRWRRFRKRYFG